MSVIDWRDRMPLELVQLIQIHTWSNLGRWTLTKQLADKAVHERITVRVPYDTALTN